MNIYISNLDQKITEQELTTLFNQYGEVTSAEVVIDVFTGQSRGFAYVEMPDADAQKAIEQLNKSQLNNLAISVEAAKPKPEHKGSYLVGSGLHRGSSFQRNNGLKKKKGFKRRF
jgi:RNA recognition motif-containing protein